MIASLEVCWFDGTRESFPAVPADARYELMQGSGSARSLPATKRTLALKPSTPAVNRSTAAARVSAVTLLRAPKLNVWDS